MIIIEEKIKILIMKNKTYDVITYGRSSIDLYSANIGAAFIDIQAFNAYVG